MGSCPGKNFLCGVIYGSISYVVEITSLHKSTNQPAVILHCEGRNPNFSQFTGRDVMAGRGSDALFKCHFSMVLYRDPYRLQGVVKNCR
jgi:hypothetical protein